MVCKVSESVKLRTTHFKKCLVSLSCSNSQATVKYSNCLKQFLKIGASVKILFSIQWFFILKLKQVFVQKILLCGMICWGCVTLRDRAPQIAISRIGEHGSKFGKHGEHGKNGKNCESCQSPGKSSLNDSFVPSRPVHDHHDHYDQHDHHDHWPWRPWWRWQPWGSWRLYTRKLEVVWSHITSNLLV